MKIRIKEYSLSAMLLCCNAYGLSCFSCVQLCGPMDQSPPGSSVYGFLQARTLVWIAVPSSGGSSWPRDQNCISYICIGRQVFTINTNCKVPKGEYLLTIHRVSKISNKTEKTDVIVGVSCMVLVGKINLKTKGFELWILDLAEILLCQQRSV